MDKINQTQSIIVYRNPLEQAFWEGTLSGQLFPVIAAVIVFFVVMMVAHNLLDRYHRPRPWNSSANGYIAMTFGAISALATCWLLWI